MFGKKEEPKIRKVKLLGVRTTEQTKIMATYNSTLYCFLIEYENGNRAIREFQADDKEIKELIMYIDMDN